jgi:hypothetical protein
VPGMIDAELIEYLFERDTLNVSFINGYEISVCADNLPVRRYKMIEIRIINLLLLKMAFFYSKIVTINQLFSNFIRNAVPQ